MKDWYQEYYDEKLDQISELTNNELATYIKICLFFRKTHQWIKRTELSEEPYMKGKCGDDILENLKEKNLIRQSYKRAGKIKSRTYAPNIDQTLEVSEALLYNFIGSRYQSIGVCRR